MKGARNGKLGERAVGKAIRYLGEYGLLGLVEIVSNKCFGIPKTMIAYPPKLGHSVRLRLHTSENHGIRQSDTR